MAITSAEAVLDPNRVYVAFDRFVCGTTRCAGSTALHTGRTIGGATVTPLTGLDIQDWYRADLGPLSCECGQWTVTLRGYERNGSKR